MGRPVKNRVGEIWTTKEGYPVTIIRNSGSLDCDIQFENGVIVKHLQYWDIRNGKVSNPYHPSVYGIGYHGIGKYKYGTNIYTKWSGMLQRQNNEKLCKKRPTYKGVIVCKEWHCLQNFGAWYEENWKPWMDSNWDLDKGILIKGNKIYSPETCCFVPLEINILFTKNNAKRGKYPIGVSFHKASGKFQAVIKVNKEKINTLYSTPEGAFECYKLYKEQRIKEIADKWKDKIHTKVYTAMYNYQVEITD